MNTPPAITSEAALAHPDPTATITLRPLESRNLDQIKEWRNELRQWTREWRFLNDDDQARWFQRVIRDERDRHIMFEIHDECFDGLIGVGGITPINWKDRSGEVSLYIGHRPALGGGCGTHALAQIIRLGFRTMNLHRLTAEIYSYNATSLTLFKRLGFVEEGRLRESRWWDGAYYDSIMLGLLASEYEVP